MHKDAALRLFAEQADSLEDADQHLSTLVDDDDCGFQSQCELLEMVLPLRQYLWVRGRAIILAGQG